MEGEGEKTPFNAEQYEGNISSVFSDGRETFGRPPESPRKRQMDSSERTLSGTYSNLEHYK